MRLLFALLSLIALSGCVSKTVFDEMVESRDYYKDEFLAADSLRMANNSLIERNQNLERELNKAEQDLNKTISANQALYRNYDELLAEYNRTLTQSQNMLKVTAYEKQYLTERLSSQQAELERQRLSGKTEINDMAPPVGMTPSAYDSSLGTSSLAAIQMQWKKQQEMMTEIHKRLNQAVAGYGSAARLQIQSQRVTLSISHSVLFTEGGFQLGTDGYEILKTVGYILSPYSGIEVLVLGRGDSYGVPETNLQYGIQRGAAVAFYLGTCGVDPSSVTASGQTVGPTGPFGIQPIMDQTDIVLTPKMDSIYQLLDR